MTTDTTNAPTLLLRLLRTFDVSLSVEGAEFAVDRAEIVIFGADAKRAVAMIEGRAGELIHLMLSRADWLRDVGLREVQP